jgi:GDP-L-fucose synthase
MCQAYHRQYGFDTISAMPTNLYGQNDNFDLQSSHVLPALIRKFHLAKLAQAGDIDAIHADEQKYGRIPDDVRENLNLDSVSPPKVLLWGSGRSYREFLHVDDMAAACLFLMNFENTQLAAQPSRLYNMGTGSDITIFELAKLVQKIVGFDGEIDWDSSKPDGTPRKLMDVSRLNALGWKASISLKDGIADAYRTYK